MDRDELPFSHITFEIVFDAGTEEKLAHIVKFAQEVNARIFARKKDAEVLLTLCFCPDPIHEGLQSLAAVLPRGMIDKLLYRMAREAARG